MTEFGRDGLVDHPWRVGRKVGRTVYAVIDLAGAQGETLIGVMDTPELAAEAVDAHNAALVGRLGADVERALYRENYPPPEGQ